MKKIICAVLIVTFLLCLYSCYGKDEAASDEPSAETVTEQESYVPTDISGIAAPFSINGIDVPYALYRYYFANVRYKYDGGDESYWEENDYTEEIRAEVMRYIRRSYAMEECAKQYGVELTEAEKAKVEQSIMTDRLQYADDDEYYRSLDGNFLTVDTFRYVEETASLEEKMLDYLTSEASGPKISDNPALIRRYIDNYVIRCDHILILNNEGDDVNENETLINELYEKLLSGADFEQLKEQYSEDEQTKYSGTGYYMAEGDISQILSDAAFSLEVGQMSGVISAPYGYHIVKRLEKDEDYIENNLSGVFLSFYQSHMLGEMLKKIMADQNIIYDDSYYTYTATTLK